MAIDPIVLKKSICEHLPDAIVVIEDLVGDNDHYYAEVTSESFRGKTLIQQHKIVYKALKNTLGDKLHALTLKTKIPE